MTVRARRIAGAILCSIGAVLLLGGATTYVRGALEQDRLRSAWDAERAHLATMAITRRLDGAVPPALVLGAPVGRLRIPRLSLDEIIVEGVGDAELNAGPGHLPGSVLPAAAGNAIISAHRDRHFHALDALSVGDTLYTESYTGRAIWVVDDRRVVRRGDPALFESRAPRLTLTTCWPVRYVGPAPDRLIVSAHEVGSSD